MSWFDRLGVSMVLACALTSGSVAGAANFTSTTEIAAQFGVHEIVLTGDGSVANPFDTIATVAFVPPSGREHSLAVQAFYDGGNTWRARVYVHEVGNWSWSSTSAGDRGLDRQTGTFACADSTLRGRLLPHAMNPRQWTTENGRWFLNLSDTAYFLLCTHDGNGESVTDAQAMQYVRDDVSHGITSLRCFLASRQGGFSESPEQWISWHFDETSLDRLRLETLQSADHRLRLLLDEFPDVAVQLILFPLEAYGRDDQFWSELSAARRERLLRNLVARFAAYPQIFWLITNDAHYGDKYPHSNAMAREVGAYLKKHDPWQHPRSTGHARRIPFHFGGEDWATYIHIEHEHDLGALEYEKYHEFGKPVFLGEDRYEQDHGPQRDPAHMRYWQRRLFWAWLLSGGSANYGGRWWTVHPYQETSRLTATYHRRPNVNFHAQLTGLDSVFAINDYFADRQIDLGEFEPDHRLAADADSHTGMQAPRLMRRGRDEVLVYHPNGSGHPQYAHTYPDDPARLHLDLRNFQGTYAVEWYRADDGEAQEQVDIVGGDWVELTAPWSGTDVVVRLLCQ